MESKKSLGQNFFINKNLAKQISDIVVEENPSVVLEIGSGTGSFTQFLRDKNFKLILIEKDDYLSSNLAKTYPNTLVANIDFLEWNLDNLKEFKSERIRFFGSLPYNVSKQIIKKIITSNYFNSACYFIIQKEVAEKYCDKEPNNSFLSVYTTLFADCKKLFDISSQSFSPKPKVTSSFVRFIPKAKPKEINEINIGDFENFLKICFKQPRKTLKNNIASRFEFKNNEAVSLLMKRPQHLSFEEFLFLFNNIK